MTPEERERDVGVWEGAGESEGLLLKLVRRESGEDVVEKFGWEKHRSLRNE